MAKRKNKANKNTTKPMSVKRFLAEKARSLPIYGCYVNSMWKMNGMAYVIVARERKDGNLCAGMYLCDIWCLGVKDAYGTINVSKEKFEENYLNRDLVFEKCDYVFAHNLIYGAEAFAADAEIEPAPEFALWRHILEEDTEDIPLMEFEFGNNGKYHLIAQPGSKEALYAHELQERLGDDFTFNIGYGPGIFHDEDDYDNEDEDEEDDEPESILDLIKRASEGFKRTSAEDKRHPEEPYSYEHPEYPDKLEIKHTFIAEEFLKPTNLIALPTKAIDRILALPHEEVVQDISNIVMYTIGKTWKGIDDATLKNGNDSSIIHSLAFLTEIGDPAGLDAVMEVLRQNSGFRDFHIGDATSMILPQALYVTGNNRTDIMEEFLMHPGYDTYAKEDVSTALSFIAMQMPERRNEIIGIYRRYLNFMQENIPVQNGCSGLLAGFIMSNLVDITAEELLPEIKRLHDSGYVNLNICGAYEEVEKRIKTDREAIQGYDFTGIKDFYSQMLRTFKH